MMRSDDVLARAGDTLERIRQRELPGKTLTGGIARRAARATKFGIGGAALVLLGAFITGLVTPLGVTGVMLTFLLMLAAMCLGVLFSREAPVRAEALPKVALARLPADAERWLQSQRRALPAPAATISDSIGVKLDILSGQLQSLDEKEPVAAGIRRLIGEELPELVTGYQRVPANLRRDGLNGISADRQLVDGLSAVDEELKRVSEQLATGDLNAFATQGRYLELKYQGDGAG